MSATPTTRSFRETVVARAKMDPGFRAELKAEALQAQRDGEPEIAKMLTVESSSRRELLVLALAVAFIAACLSVGLRAGPFRLLP